MRGPGELRRRLRSTPPARGRGVGHGDDRIPRPDSRAWSLTARTHATSLRMASVMPLMLREHLLPGFPGAARRRTRLVRPRPRRSHPRRAPRVPSCSAAPRSPSPAAPEPIPTHLTPRDADASRSADSHRGSSVTTRHERAPLAPAPGVGALLVEHPGEPAVAGAVRLLRGLGRHERRRDDGVEHVSERGDVGSPRHLEQARRRDRRQLGAVGEDDVPRAPRERVAAEVRADGAELLG